MRRVLSACISLTWTRFAFSYSMPRDFSRALLLLESQVLNPSGCVIDQLFGRSILGVSIIISIFDDFCLIDVMLHFWVVVQCVTCVVVDFEREEGVSQWRNFFLKSQIEEQIQIVQTTPTKPSSIASQDSASCLASTSTSDSEGGGFQTSKTSPKDSILHIPKGLVIFAREACIVSFIALSRVFRGSCGKWIG